jgi:DNA-binding response OmpR family regulator
MMAALEDANLLTAGNLALNAATFRVTVDSAVVELSYHEFELLRILLTNLDRVITYEALTEELWRQTGRPAVRHLNVLIHRLRGKLAGSQPYVIETVRGRGYGLLKANEPPASRPAGPSTGAKSRPEEGARGIERVR